MLDRDQLPRIRVDFDGRVNHPAFINYEEIIRVAFKRIFPKGFFGGSGNDEEFILNQFQGFENCLPLFKRYISELDPFTHSFFMLCPERLNGFKFFFEMVSRWLVPGTRLEVISLYAADFCFPDLADRKFTLSEVMVRVRDEQELKVLEYNLPFIEREVCLGISSEYHAQRILEMKGLTSDEKSSMVLEQATLAFRRRPQDFDYGIFTEMQHVLVMCTESFRQARQARHLCRIICTMYLFRKEIRKRVERQKGKRYLSLKIMRARIKENSEIRGVLGLVIGVNFLRENEVLHERDIMKAIQNYVPNTKLVESSFLENGNGLRGEKVSALYMEIEKLDGSDFLSSELRALRKMLPSDLKDRVEHLMHPIFMPRNEEEVLRHILSLSDQIKMVSDIPQVVITFDEQTDSHIQFTVILVRVLTPDSPKIADLFTETETEVEWIPDQCKQVGMTQKKYYKEANVFHLRLLKQSFLRRNNSLDLYKARQYVSAELSRVIGEYRDYNGGMISKQNELFCALRNRLGLAGDNKEFILENFFYSLQPVLMRTVLEPEPLHTLFLMLIEGLEEGFFMSGHNVFYKSQSDKQYLYVMIAAEDSDLKELVVDAVGELRIPSLQLACTSVNVSDTPCLGYIYRNDDEEAQEQFLNVIEGVLKQFSGFVKSEPQAMRQEALTLSL